MYFKGDKSKIVLKNLAAEMARSSVSYAGIADTLKITERTVREKVKGRFRFYVDEAILIRDTFFPEKAIEYLFKSFD